MSIYEFINKTDIRHSTKFENALKDANIREMYDLNIKEGDDKSKEVVRMYGLKKLQMIRMREPWLF